MTRHVREEVAADHPRVFEVERAAFGSPLQARLVESLRASADPRLSLVAVEDGAVVGHVFFSPVTFRFAAARTDAPQLSPVAVLPSHQGRDIGSQLIREGLARCPSRGWSVVFLVGNPAYYSRFGFRMAGPLGLSCPGPHGPFLQVVELGPDALRGASGAVDFHPAFDEHEG